MLKDLKKCLWLSQISLLGLLVVCCLIIPSVVVANGGVSNFGNHRSTVVLYILAFSLCVFFVYLSGRILIKLSSSKRLGVLLYVLAFLYLLVLVSTFPRHISWTFSEIHDYLGIVLFAYEFVLSIWLVLNQKSYKSYLMLVIEAVGSMTGLLSILKFIHLLFIGQMVGAIGFGIILVALFPRLIEFRLAKTDKPNNY